MHRCGLASHKPQGALHFYTFSIWGLMNLLYWYPRDSSQGFIHNLHQNLALWTTENRHNMCEINAFS